MDTFNDLVLHALLFSALCCISIIKDTVCNSQQSQNEWSEEEISDLVDYLFHHLTTDPWESFPPGSYENLAIHLAHRHPDKIRTVAAIRSKFNSVRVFLYIELYVDLSYHSFSKLLPPLIIIIRSLGTAQSMITF